MATMVSKTCPVCRDEFKARLSDVKRGWGKFCSKSCKAKEQEKRTGQYKNYLRGNTPTRQRLKRIREEWRYYDR